MVIFQIIHIKGRLLQNRCLKGIRKCLMQTVMDELGQRWEDKVNILKEKVGGDCTKNTCGGSGHENNVLYVNIEYFSRFPTHATRE